MDTVTNRANDAEMPNFDLFILTSLDGAYDRQASIRLARVSIKVELRGNGTARSV
jgi:hypothetical protein